MSWNIHSLPQVLLFNVDWSGLGAIFAMIKPHMKVQDTMKVTVIVSVYLCDVASRKAADCELPRLSWQHTCV